MVDLYEETKGGEGGGLGMYVKGCFLFFPSVNIDDVIKLVELWM